MHKDYSGDLAKGVCVTPEWVSQARSKYLRGGPTTQNVSARSSQPRRVAAPSSLRTPTSVLCAPTHADWTATNWTEGVGALADFEPEESTAPALTKPHPDRGWDVHTKPEELFGHFFTQEFRAEMLKWTNKHAANKGAGR